SQEYTQTQWATGWHAALSGFGEAALFLTENRKHFGATIDQVGLALFFLQRHRVELGLKLILAEESGDPVPGTHDLDTLWDACERAVRSTDANAWASFAKDVKPFVDVISRTDRGSFTFRYPVD